MITFDDLRGSCERIRLIKNGIGNGNGQIANGIAINHIPKIDQSEDMLIARI